MGVSPDGDLLNSVEELPELPLPKKVIVGGDAMRVDGWIFRVWPIGKRTLDWLGRQATRWYTDDPSPENKAQVNGVIEAIETMIQKKPQKGGTKQGEFEF
ncbi:MAG: hypothetical protein D4R65_08695 [Verrucomicrobiaceae bacterium]|nr:MAG: hypothetical protein D4R65_08695 [Verrucomicrobiaceae bacterium]